jgi:hypothetical protein
VDKAAVRDRRKFFVVAHVVAADAAAVPAAAGAVTAVAVVAVVAVILPREFFIYLSRPNF